MHSWKDGDGLTRRTSSPVVVCAPSSSSARNRIVSFERPAAVGKGQIAHRGRHEIESLPEPLLEDVAGSGKVAALVELHPTSSPLFCGVARASISPICLRRIADQVPSAQES